MSMALVPFPTLTIHKFPIKRFHLPLRNLPPPPTTKPSINFSSFSSLSHSKQPPISPPNMKSELSPTMAALKKDPSSETALSFFLSRKARYKFWALAAILLLAFWSMFTGSVSLKWSAGTFARFYDGPLKPIFDDLDILVNFFCHFYSGFLFLLLELVF